MKFKPLQKIMRWWSALKRLMQKNTWLIRLFNLPVCRQTKLSRGLILIQIDGLGRHQFLSALDKGRLPFVRKLLQNKSSHIHRPLYSGQPSSTPAFQAELFYGVKTFVPAFEFVDRQKGQKHVCFNPNSAKILGSELTERGTPLLSYGHAYATLFSGNAKEAFYCSDAISLEGLIKSLNPFKFLFLLLIHMDKMIRLAAYTLLEFILALIDFIRGWIKGHDLLKEMTYLPTRVIVCIVLRELVRMRMKMDIARGVPILCANMLGYDEQSHRRGPSSGFAHWSLKGIDDVIRDIFHTARKSACLSYDMIVYSDHGQESVNSYEAIHGIPVKNKIQLVLSEQFPDLFDRPPNSVEKTLETLYRKMRFVVLKSDFSKADQAGMNSMTADRIQVTTMGPLGHVYLPKALPVEKMPQAARYLVDKARIPLVMFVRDGRVMAVTRNKMADFRKDGVDIIGRDHPFLNQVTEDLMQVVKHRHAGDFVISGWQRDQQPLSFNSENGAHGGPGKNETQAFVILPKKLAANRQNPMRAMDIRKLVQKKIHQIETPLKKNADRQLLSTLNVVSYNIHSCINMNRRCNPARTAAVLASLSPDIVALQEVDSGKRRSNFTKQARYLGRQLGMTYHFYPLIRHNKERYGLGILSRFPVVDLSCDTLPASGLKKNTEPRGVMSATIETSMGILRFINTHLGLQSKDRTLQVDKLLQDHLTQEADADGLPTILCGDLNAGPRSAIYQKLSARLNDVQTLVPDHKPQATFFSWYPLRRIDHIFLSNHLSPIWVDVPASMETRMVSDHLPVVAQVRLNPDNH